MDKKGFNKTFWIDEYKGHTQGGFFYRSFDFNQFLRKMELEKGMNIVGLKFDENNVEIIVEADADGKVKKK